MKLTIPERANDWSDCHSGPVQPADTPARVAFQRSLAAAPGWMKPALALRNLIVAPFGLTTGAAGSQRDASSGPAAFLGKMPVLVDRPDLFETGITDRHLTFTIQVRIKDGQADVSTRIWFHHWLGRVYLYAVLPAHNLILKRLVRSLGEPA